VSSLRKRLERLEKARRGGAVIIFMKPGETKEEARQRDLAEHPEHEDAEGFIFIGISAPGPPCAPPPLCPEPQPRPRVRVVGNRPLQITK
jgi:hypothetical protein